jgi:hypothetical protein
MIAIKTALFFLSLTATLYLIEDAIEQIIINSKKDPDMFRAEYVYGLSNTFSGKLLFITLLFWTLFYLANQF